MPQQWSPGERASTRYLYALTAAPVVASGRRDTLIGGGGQDLFYAQVGTDLVLDRTANEIVFPIHPKQRRTNPTP